jgi:thiamine-monophosphate kinase
MKEFDIIARYYAPLSSKVSGALGLKDDAAFIPERSGHELVITKDAIAEDVHFVTRRNPLSGEGATPRQIAKKLVRTNLSDLAAMGARPKYYLIASVLNNIVDEAWVRDFSAGLAEDQEEFDISLIGGDTVKHGGPLCFSLTMIGEVKKGRHLTRTGAKPGDMVYVSGTIGDGALGLGAFRGEVKGISREAREYLIDRYHIPRPRVKLGMGLAESGLVSAAMDISDGLLGDLEHICACSKVDAVVHQSRIPLSDGGREALRFNPEYWRQVFTGGDDYELLFTVPKNHREELEALAKNLSLPVTPIGEIKKGEGKVSAVDAAGKPLAFPQKGYTHF